MHLYGFGYKGRTWGGSNFHVISFYYNTRKYKLDKILVIYNYFEHYFWLEGMCFL